MYDNAEDSRIELFIFPDGTSVEMIVFGHEAVAPRPLPRAPHAAEAPLRRPQAPRAAPPRPGRAPMETHEEREAHVCPLCGSRLVYPLNWERDGDATWNLTLRCPECETRRDISLSRRGVEALNRELYRGVQELAREADTISRRNFEEEAQKLVKALERDLILPMDF
jgi:DNA-directed RNA polymerase subunit RPC12/RpoP